MKSIRRRDLLEEEIRGGTVSADDLVEGRGRFARSFRGCYIRDDYYAV